MILNKKLKCLSLRKRVVEKAIIQDLLYLDPEFVSMLYEEVTGEQPFSEISKTESMDAGASVTLFSAGVRSEETKTYKLSTMQMFKSISPELEKFPRVEISSIKSARAGRIAWTEGTLQIGEWSPEKAEGEFNTFFEFKDSSGLTTLLTNPEYFYFGLGLLPKSTAAIRNNFLINVRCLMRPLFPAKNHDGVIIRPLVIVEFDKAI